jgi:hypothetical protein
MVVFKKEIRIIRRLGFAACLSKNFVQKLIFIYVDMFDGADGHGFLRPCGSKRQSRVDTEETIFAEK